MTSKKMLMILIMMSFSISIGNSAEKIVKMEHDGVNGYWLSFDYFKEINTKIELLESDKQYLEKRLTARVNQVASLQTLGDDYDLIIEDYEKRIKSNIGQDVTIRILTVTTAIGFSFGLSLAIGFAAFLVWSYYFK
jgi:guanylate kinase